MSESLKEVLNPNHNPNAVLEAVIAPAPLTIAKVAILEKAKSPVLFQDVTNLGEDVKATYLVSLPYAQAAQLLKNPEDLENKAMEWAEKVGWDEYEKKLVELVDGLISFWKMFPPAEKKKTETSNESETVGSEN